MTAASHELERMILRLSDEFCLSDPEIVGLLVMYANLSAVQAMGYLIEDEDEDDDDEGEEWKK